MSENTDTYELAVIGTGMAGMAATLFAANRGISVAQAGTTGEIIFASGYFDLMGIHPLEEKKIWKDPWAARKALIRDIPNHPYARVRQKDILAAFEEIISFLQETGLQYCRMESQNSQALTPVGTVKTTYAVPQTMWAGVQALAEKPPCLVVGFKGLKGFSAHQVAGNLQHKWPKLRAVRIPFPGNLEGELYAEQMARSLDFSGNREKLALAVQPHLKDAKVVGMPAILGMYQTRDVLTDLEHHLGVPVFEIPTLPPSVPGLRLKETFEQGFQKKAVQQFSQKRVLKAQSTPEGNFVLDISRGETPEHQIQAKGVILATGRFLGRGLSAERKRIRETLFDLPVFQPEARLDWHRKDFLDSRGHPLNRAGLETDDRLRPVDASGKPMFQRLFAAGAILAHQDWIRMKCGAGLAIATAYKAVDVFLKNVR